MKLNDFIRVAETKTETPDFKEILKVFLPVAKKILELDKLPKIILKKTIDDQEQPTMGRFNDETYSLELAINNRQPVDTLRTLAHELVHAKQHRNHVDIDPTTGSDDENEANVQAGIVMREFNKLYPEFLKVAPISEGGNLSVDGHEAQQIDLKVHDRKFMVPLLDSLLKAINNSFAKTYKVALWKPELLASRKFLSGSSLHFFDTNIPDDAFVQRKPKVGDIDTQVDKTQEQNLEAFLNSVKGKLVGPATCLGFSRGNEQFSSLWELQDPPIKIQIDLEFVAFEKDEPTQWAQFSHSSSWEDLNAGIKGVFHKYMMRALTANSATQKYVARQLKKGVKISDEPVVDSNLSFAVSSKQGGGMREKYQPYIDPATGQPMMKNGIPVMLQIPSGDSEYIQDLGQQYNMLFGQNGEQADQKLMWSFLGNIKLANKYLTDEQRTDIAMAFEEMLFAHGAQGLYKGDPVRDQQEKMVALNTLAKQLQGIDAQAVLGKAQQDGQEYYTKYKGADESITIGEAIGEAGGDPQPAVKAQLRKGMPHLRDLKPNDLLDLIDEIHDGNGNFKLQNIPLNVKVDGFGGRFGKDAEGKPFMATSRTEPRYEAGFAAYHEKKGTTDPEILGRAKLFDNLFTEMMAAVALVDSKLGKDFLINKQVTCEVLFLPFATRTPEGRLKFVGIHYDELPQGVELALVPFRVVDAESGEDLPNSEKVIRALTGLGKQGSVMFIDNSLTQNEALDVTAIVPPLENIEQIKSLLASGKLAGKREAKEVLAPVALALEKAIINDPNIVGKDMLGKDYEGIVLNTRLGPVKVTSAEQRQVIADKNAAKANARTERPRGENKTAVVAIGSFVGHKGHQQLFDYTINKAKQVGGDPYVFIGNAVGKDDPIPVATKVETWHKLYPQYASNISAVTQEGGSLMQKIKHELINPLPGKPPRYDNIIIMVGEDQANMPIAGALMKAVNKFQGYEHVKVSLEVTPRGTGMSFTKLRNILKDPNATPGQQYAVWADGFDAKTLGREYVEKLMDITRKGMGVQAPAVKQPVPAKAKQPVPQEEPMAEEGEAGSARAVGQKASSETISAAQGNAASAMKTTAESQGKKKGADGKACWKGYRYNGTKNGKDSCVKVGEGWEAEIADVVNKLVENFADGKKPGRKGLAKRSGVNTKASVSDLRKTAKNSTGEKARMAHWMANMKAGKAKK